MNLLEADPGSVQAATSARRRSGSGSISAEVLSEIGTPGQAARMASITAAEAWASRVSAPDSS